MNASGAGGLPTAQIGEPLDGLPPPPDPPCLDRDDPDHQRELQDLFFSGLKRDIANAKAICRTCPYTDSCLSMALNIPGPIYGVWGGYSEVELRLMRTRRRRAPT